MKSYEMQKQISEHLQKGLSAKEIFQKIKEDSKVHEVAQFLYQSELYKTLILYSIEKLKSKKPVPWTFVLKVLLDHSVSIPKKEMVLLREHLASRKKKRKISKQTNQKSKKVSAQPPHLKKHDSDFLEKENELFKKLQFVKREGFLNEEEKIVKQLLLMQPDNLKYKEHHLEVKEKRARQILEENKKNQSHQKTVHLFMPEKSKMKSDLCKRIDKIAEANPKNSKNLSLFLYFMGWPDEALVLLKKYPNQPTDIYFLLDWLIKTNQYVLSLDYIDKILKTSNINSDMLFLMSYKKAQILYYLGKTDEAKRYIEDIIKIRPDYRSAQSLLKHWEDDESDTETLGR